MQLISILFSFSVDLLSLLRWRSAPEGIRETLFRLTRVDGAETVKFLQDVLDALFAMFSTDDGNSTQYSGHVFQAMVRLHLGLPANCCTCSIFIISNNFQLLKLDDFQFFIWICHTI